ncbi:MAG: ABC transporter ATP-binding protein [Alphaproteobacteria bacterium]
MTVLRAEGVSKTFGGVRAVDGLDFTVTRGHIHSLIGPNGAGKTTLLNLITGIYAPSAGAIYLDGDDITGLPAHRLAALGISRSFQNTQLFFNMTAIENVLVGAHLHSDTGPLATLLRLPRFVRDEKANRGRAAELMDFIGLGDALDTEAAALPYGALKRLEIARALATRPKVLLLDEPAAGLNPAETDAIDRLIQRIAESGVTVVLVEHDMRLVMGVSDRITVLDRGRWLAEGTAMEIRHDPKVVAAYLGEEGRNL